MQLIGQSVEHPAFGRGVITGHQENIITVEFSRGEKRFLYPDAFQKFLTMVNEAAGEKVDSLLQSKEEEKDARIQAILDEQERENRLHHFKIPVNAHAAFAMELGNEDALKTWTVSTGTYLSGGAKGEPRIPDRMKPCSLCILTQRPPEGGEEKRMIAGLFMVPEDFFGEECGDGLIHAHPTYRLALKKNQQLPFWGYFKEDLTKLRWGSGTFKACSNQGAQAIIRDLRAKLQGSREEEAMDQFYRYFCSQNQLSN